MGNDPVSLETDTALLPESAGVKVLSSSSGVITAEMPVASSCAGSQWIFRAGSEHAHVITGTTSFTDGTDVGNQIALEATVGCSVVLVSDGLNFVILGNSGTLTLS